MESSNQKITRKTQVQMGGQRQTGHNFQSLRKFSAWRRRRKGILNLLWLRRWWSYCIQW